MFLWATVLIHQYKNKLPDIKHLLDKGSLFFCKKWYQDKKCRPDSENAVPLIIIGQPSITFNKLKSGYACCSPFAISN